MKRQHQFDKVELVKFVVARTPGRAQASRWTRSGSCSFEASYRVMALCGGDMGFCAAKTSISEVVTGRERVDRDLELQQLRRLSGETHQIRCRDEKGVVRSRPHVERLGAGRRRHRDRDRGELPESGWDVRRSRGPEEVRFRANGCWTCRQATTQLCRILRVLAGLLEGALDGPAQTRFRRVEIAGRSMSGRAARQLDEPLHFRDTVRGAPGFSRSCPSRRGR